MIPALALALSACVSPQAPRSSPPSAPRPAVQSPAPAPSAASVAVRQHFERVQTELLAMGLLRSDGGGRDTPFNDRQLAENFIRIALYDEYARGPNGPVQRQTESRLRRWEQPVRVALRFGPGVSATSRATDTARIRSYLARLSRLTGHPITLADQSANFTIHIVNEDERRALGPVIQQSLPGLTSGEVAGITQMPLSTYCLVYAMSDGDSGRYTRAVAVIRAEHPDLLRLSCMHEEIAQGLGLANDSPRARPSIFNDDEEFALLTGQDELMLRMLYSPELRPGMTEAEARPIIQSLAKRLIGGES
ncbi:DUF2927 domain-containing protein [Pseudotabrizicola sp. L79]|uniref:DUF2927 domain-containing protein n=1 Tax=Pseudotabrizicola sp. L79 TaxID=3118402 RepID=UPI0040546685